MESSAAVGRVPGRAVRGVRPPAYSTRRGLGTAAASFAVPFAPAFGAGNIVASASRKESWASVTAARASLSRRAAS
ncbi:hypothetical protein [Streptomyces sp. NPDC002530]